MKRILTKLFIALALRIWKYEEAPQLRINAKLINFPIKRRDSAEVYIQVYNGESCCLCIRKIRAGLAEPICHAIATICFPEMSVNLWLQMKEDDH
ncbi:MAG: hypothetical protein WCO60_11550 [Verrucomicrobiota bacterium]